MSNVATSSMDYAKREEFVNRLQKSIRHGDKFVKKVMNVSVKFHPSFDSFAAGTAYALRHHMTYRSDGGRIARGLVRASGDLYKIHAFFNSQATPAGIVLRLDTLFWRRKDAISSGRWVMNIRFAPSDIANMEGEVIGANEGRIHKHRLDEFMDRAVILAKELPGPVGKRVRAILDLADDLSPRKMKDLWYYSPPAVKHFMSFHTVGKDRRQMTKATGGRVPFRGSAYKTGSWRNQPFDFIARVYVPTWSDREIKAKIVGIDNAIFQSRDEIVQVLAKTSLGGGSAYGPTVQKFVKHVKSLEKDPKHLYGAFKGIVKEIVIPFWLK